VCRRRAAQGPRATAWNRLIDHGFVGARFLTASAERTSPATRVLVSIAPCTVPEAPAVWAWVRLHSPQAASTLKVMSLRRAPSGPRTLTW
jgi:hypothetical protein